MCFILNIFNLCKKPKKKLLSKEQQREDDFIEKEKEHLNSSLNFNKNNINSYNNNRNSNDIFITTINEKSLTTTNNNNNMNFINNNNNNNNQLKNGLFLNLNRNINDIGSVSGNSSVASSACSSCNSMNSLNNFNNNENNNNNTNTNKKILLVNIKDENLNDNHSANIIDDENPANMNKDNIKRPQLNLNFQQRSRIKFDSSFLIGNNNNMLSKPKKLFDEINNGFIPPTPPTTIFQNKDLNNNLPFNNQFYRQKPVSSLSFAEKAGKLTITQDQVYDFTESDLSDFTEIGHGEFGSVYKCLHKPTNTLMALKKIRSVDGREQQKLLKELDIVMQCNDFTYVVQFYGVNNKDGDFLICMELMDTSLDLFYKYIYEVLNQTIPERVLGQILLSALNALHYLKEKLQIIHRDVKPSNILLNKQGAIKLCDFGISGRLVNSFAQTLDVGCRPYMAPERIDPNRQQSRRYDVRSDVWSLGITLYELATGKFPYPQWNSVFEQLQSVLKNEAPRLERSDRLSENFCNFVNTCLTKDDSKRPKYKDLLKHPFVLEQLQNPIQITDYVTSIIDKMNSNSK